MNKPDHIIISRTDSIGDVVLTLPLAGWLKKQWPGVHLSFLGREYTQPVINACVHVDEYLSIDSFKNMNPAPHRKNTAIIHVFPVRSLAFKAKNLKIPWRIGTTNRLYHWVTCNKLVRLSRRRSDLHEAQLNIRLLTSLGIDADVSLNEIPSLYGLEKIATLQPAYSRLIDPGKYNIILHPRSQGHSREWGIENFIALANSLQPDRYKIFISGTAAEKPAIQPLLDALRSGVNDITGMMELDQFIAFINACQGMVSNSTGPLHLAAALGKDAIGLYPPIRPIHPGRWAPVGKRATYFVSDKVCNDCRQDPLSCHCIMEISVSQIKMELDKRSAQ